MYLDSFRPYLKAVVPFILTAVAAVIHGLVTGEWDKRELEITIYGWAASSVAFAVTNGSDGLARYAKAIGPAVLTLVALGLHWAFTGEWNRSELALAITGLSAAVITFFVPNTEVIDDNIVYDRNEDEVLKPRPQGDVSKFGE